MSCAIWRLGARYGAVYVEDKDVARLMAESASLPERRENQMAVYLRAGKRVGWQFTFPLESWNRVADMVGLAGVLPPRPAPSDEPPARTSGNTDRKKTSPKAAPVPPDPKRPAEKASAKRSPTTSASAAAKSGPSAGVAAKPGPPVRSTPRSSNARPGAALKSTAPVSSRPPAVSAAPAPKAPARSASSAAGSKTSTTAKPLPKVEAPALKKRPAAETPATGTSRKARAAGATSPAPLIPSSRAAAADRTSRSSPAAADRTSRRSQPGESAPRSKSPAAPANRSQLKGPSLFPDEEPTAPPVTLPSKSRKASKSASPAVEPPAPDRRDPGLPSPRRKARQ